MPFKMPTDRRPRRLPWYPHLGPNQVQPHFQDGGNCLNQPHVVARPLKTPRLSAQHMHATQLNAFKVEYVGPLTDSPEALQPPEPPEGNSWLEYYTQHGLAKLSEAQSTKAVRCKT